MRHSRDYYDHIKIMPLILYDFCNENEEYITYRPISGPFTTTVAELSTTFGKYPMAFGYTQSTYYRNITTGEDRDEKKKWVDIFTMNNMMLQHYDLDMDTNDLKVRELDDDVAYVCAEYALVFINKNRVQQFLNHLGITQQWIQLRISNGL